jgi:hypothetical protein
VSDICAGNARKRNPAIVIKGKFQKRLLSLKEKESGLFAFLVRGEVIPKKGVKTNNMNCFLAVHSVQLMPNAFLPICES